MIVCNLNISKKIYIACSYSKKNNSSQGNKSAKVRLGHQLFVSITKSQDLCKASKSKGSNSSGKKTSGRYLMAQMHLKIAAQP